MKTSFTIPRANTPEREEFDNTVVGYLVGSLANCGECINEKISKGKISPMEPTAVYGINIAPYSLTCCHCGRIIVDGARKPNGSPLNLFDGS